MLKKLCITLILVLAIAVGGTIAAEKGDMCEVPANAKVFILMGDGTAMPVMPNNNIAVGVGNEISEELVKNLNETSIKNGVPMDWSGANYVITDDSTILIVRDQDMTCLPIGKEG